MLFEFNRLDSRNDSVGGGGGGSAGGGDSESSPGNVHINFYEVSNFFFFLIF